MQSSHAFQRARRAPALAMCRVVLSPAAHAGQPIARVEVHDRTSGETLAVHRKFGERWIVGERGQRWERCADAGRLRDRTRRKREHRGLAQEPRAHGRFRIHDPVSFLRGEDTPSGRHRGDRRRAVSRARARTDPHSRCSARSAQGRGGGAAARHGPRPQRDLASAVDRLRTRQRHTG